MSNVSSATDGKTVGGLQGRHVLYGFIAFFGVIFLVNGVFLYSALSTNTGVVANEPYRKGLAYNERIAAEEQQKTLGWQDDVSITREGGVGMVVRNTDGSPVSGLIVEATLSRPATSTGERKLRLAELSPGSYGAASNAIEPGNWLLVVEARREANAAEPIYRSRRRLWLKP